jgi:hypothetical protein
MSYRIAVGRSVQRWFFGPIATARLMQTVTYSDDSIIQCDRAFSYIDIQQSIIPNYERNFCTDFFDTSTGYPFGFGSLEGNPPIDYWAQPPSTNPQALLTNASLVITL